MVESVSTMTYPLLTAEYPAGAVLRPPASRCEAGGRAVVTPSPLSVGENSIGEFAHIGLC